MRLILFVAWLRSVGIIRLIGRPLLATVLGIVGLGSVWLPVLALGVDIVKVVIVAQLIFLALAVAIVCWIHLDSDVRSFFQIDCEGYLTQAEPNREHHHQQRDWTHDLD